MESTANVINLPMPNIFMASMNKKDAYFSI